MILSEKNLYLENIRQHHFVPISISFILDTETPISIFLKLKANYLLESAETKETIGRYSVIAKGKRIMLSFRNKKMTIKHYHPDGIHLQKEEVITLDNPLEYLKSWMQRYTAPAFKQLPEYFGGWVGYLSHESIAYFEPRTPIYPNGSEKDDLNIPDGIIIFPQLICVMDNLLRQLQLIQMDNGPIDDPKNSFDRSSLKDQALLEHYQEQINSLKEIKKELTQPLTHQVPPTKVTEGSFNLTKKLTDQEYQKLVVQAKKYIVEGEIIQVVLSNRFLIKAELDAFEIYRTLTHQNPSPYLYFLDFETFKLIGSSPEVMVKMNQDQIMLKPIAGSRKRGSTSEEDEKLTRELLQDEKELSEHIMLVDLGRNDLSRVSEFGTVKVENYMSIEKYSQIQHIVSTVKAKKRHGIDAIDLIKATFPAGTLSGAPKIRAMEIIHELEKSRRGPYGGLIFFLSLNGNLDSCITIRTILQKGQQLFIQAGAGIVKDSNPEKESEECHHKALALIKAIQSTQERLKPDSLS